MCGFAGFHLRSPIESTVLEEMTVNITHRGPDDFGHYAISPSGKKGRWRDEIPNELSQAKVGIGFRRLSILDLSPAGAQPMVSEDGRYILAFNGEIYNYVELKQTLPDVKWRSSGDSEVLLHLLIRYREEALEKLNGIFAFSFLDTQTGEMLVARDHFGVKPVYLYSDNRGLFFGSEIRALQAATGKLSLNRQLVGRYLACNWIADPDTLFEGVKKLEPGHCIRISGSGEWTIRRYWDMNFEPDENVSLAHWTEELGVKLDGALERQLRSDVPVAFFLSGGVDSSLLAAKAIQHKQNPTTFTVGFNWKNTSSQDDLDVKSARFLKSRFPLDYREILLEPSIVSLLPKVIGTLEEPISDPAAIPSYLICQEAAKEFKVLISGQGADELFGGYPVFVSGVVEDTFRGLPDSAIHTLAAASHLLPYSLFGKRMQTVHRLKKFLSSSKTAWPMPFLTLRSGMTDEDVKKLISPEAAFYQLPPYQRHLEHFERSQKWDALSQALYLDSKTYLPSLNLMYTDKTSMAHSLEVRVPYLDLEIVKLVSRLPSRYKKTLTESKLLLKHYADRVLPKEIVHRKKAGFGLPVRDWFLNDLQPMARELFQPGRLGADGLVDSKVALQWLDEHRERKADHNAKLYLLMTFQLWREAYAL